LSGGWVNELGGKSANAFRRGIAIHCPVLLIHGDNDRVFPVSEAQHLAAVLQTDGVAVDLRILRGAEHDFGPDWPIIIREMAEYCQAHLPLPDYTYNLRDC